MREQISNSTVSLIPGIDGDLQLVHSASGLYVIDIQGAHRDVDGNVRHDHGTVRLTYDAVCDLRNLLDQIAEPAEYRQSPLPGVWSNASFTLPVPARFRRRVI